MSAPVTRSELVRALAELGLRRNDLVIVHASLSAVGYVVGGAVTMCLALDDALGPGGTLVMPGFTPQLCHPASWPAARLAGADAAVLAEQMPPFDRQGTPVAKSIGTIANCLRAMTGTLRSDHPLTSFLARGRLAAPIVATHPLAYRLSSAGPLGELWDRDAKVLMVGVPWSKCTALHLAEYSVPYPGRRKGLWQVPVGTSGTTQWQLVEELLVWEGDFDAIGARFESIAADRRLHRGRIGLADSVVVPIRGLVRFAQNWLPRHRDLRHYGNPPGWCAIIEADGPLPIRMLADSPADETHCPS